MKKVIAVFSIYTISVSAIDIPVHSRENIVKIISGVKGDKKGGNITPKTSEYAIGEDVTFHITPNKGYRIKQVWVNGVAIGPVDEYTFYNIQEDSTIYCEFERDGTPTTKEETTKRNSGKVSPDTGAELSTTVVLCVLGTMVIGSVAAVVLAKKSRKEEY